MGCTVSELLSRITASELAEWMAYYLLDGTPDFEAVAKAQIKQLKGAGEQGGKRS